MSQANTFHQAAIDEYYGIRPQRFPVVASVELIQEEGEPPEALAVSFLISLRSQSPDEKSRLTLKFWRITELELKQPPVSEWQLLLDVRTASDMGWERVNFRVVDNEQQSVRFLCERFEFEIRGEKMS